MGDVSTGMTGAGRLGQTLDPRELVPGSPEALQDVARQFDTYAQELEQVGVRLGRIDVPGWTGRAASAFHDSLATERSRWLQGSDMLSAGAAAIRDHAQVLLVAQRRAQEAIELWEQGVAATGAARERYASTLPLPVGTEAGATPPPFVDPGAEIRRTAEQVLEEARALVRESGQRAAQALTDNCGRGGGGPSWLARVADLADRLIREHGVGGTSLRFGPDGTFRDWKVNLGQADLFSASVWGGEVEGSTELGPVGLRGSAGLDVLGVDSSAQLSLGPDGLRGELSGSAYLVDAHAEGSAEWGIAEVGAEANAFVGAEASVYATAGLDGVSLGGEAFAGARADISAHADVGGIGAGATAEGWAGAGIEGDITAGRNDDGSWTIGVEGGAALGLGGKLGFEVTVDPAKVVDTATSAADAVGDFAGSAADAVGNAFDAAAGAVRSIPTPW